MGLIKYFSPHAKEKMGHIRVSSPFLALCTGVNAYTCDNSKPRFDCNTSFLLAVPLPWNVLSWSTLDLGQLDVTQSKNLHRWWWFESSEWETRAMKRCTCNCACMHVLPQVQELVNERTVTWEMIRWTRAKWSPKGLWRVCLVCPLAKTQ